MTTEILSTAKLIALFNEEATQFIRIISSFNEKKLNIFPFADSWTAAQVAAHVIKVNKSIARSLREEGKITDRSPDDRVPELKKIFLDFTAKYQSPEFVKPEEHKYEKEWLITELKNSVERLTEAGKQINLSEIIVEPALGEITKPEMLYFIIFHTQRHIYQLRNICTSLKNYESKRMF